LAYLTKIVDWFKKTKSLWIPANREFYKAGNEDYEVYEVEDFKEYFIRFFFERWDNKKLVDSIAEESDGEIS
jgi:hypothetical protein